MFLVWQPYFTATMVLHHTVSIPGVPYSPQGPNTHNCTLYHAAPATYPPALYLPAPLLSSQLGPPKKGQLSVYLPHSSITVDGKQQQHMG